MTGALGAAEHRGTAGSVGAVIFDWGGTITPWHTVDLTSSGASSRASARTRRGRRRGLADELAARILEAESAGWPAAATSAPRPASRTSSPRPGSSPTTRAPWRALAAYQAFWEPHTFTDPQMRPLWEGLHDNGIRVGVLSNTIWTRDYHRGLFERDGVLDLRRRRRLLQRDRPGEAAPGDLPDASAAARRRAARVRLRRRPRCSRTCTARSRSGMRAILVPHCDIPASQRVASRRDARTPSRTSCSTCSTSSPRWDGRR